MSLIKHIHVHIHSWPGLPSRRFLCLGREAQPRVLGPSCLAGRGGVGAPGDALLQQDGGIVDAGEERGRRTTRARVGQIRTRPCRRREGSRGDSCDQGDVWVSAMPCSRLEGAMSLEFVNYIA